MARETMMSRWESPSNSVTNCESTMPQSTALDPSSAQMATKVNADDVAYGVESFHAIAKPGNLNKCLSFAETLVFHDLSHLVSLDLSNQRHPLQLS